MKVKCILISFFLLTTTHGMTQKSRCDDIPLFNVEMVNLVNKKFNKQVGAGSTREFITYALDNMHATWNLEEKKLGREVNTDYYCVYPGDIIYFDNVVIDIDAGTRMLEDVSLSEHYAIVSEVIGDGKFSILHQGFLPEAKRVIVTRIDIKEKKSGNISFYRGQ